MSSVSVPQESSHSDELLMQQGLLFSDTLKDLKSLRKQLYSAADYFERTYNEEEQKELVEDTLKDYAIKALINTVDHLGSVAYKVNNFLDDKMVEISGMDLRLSCLEQRLRTCREFVSLGGLSQQSLVFEAHNKHHKRYIFPVEQTLNDVAETIFEFHPNRMPARLDLHQFNNIDIQAVAAETPSESITDAFYALHSPQSLPRKSPRLFTSISMNQRQENRSNSPRHFLLPRSGSVMQRSSSPSHSNAKKRWPSEPRRTVSMSTSLAERERAKDMEQYSSKGKRLLKAMLSLRKSKKNVTLHKFLDEN
ncbi:protein ABIL2 [Gossypium raimondii]|uniref:Protein ABIL2 n=2 Tax=Gossypium raimondii TaxID=29730 RepID=A0A0D2TCQ7_GOSRA|nr:protein ABIL2 [Gossypium raimondii]KJB52328.1 hypothetical protein B456_008G256500 [Gossypium raimondii]KJB52331.1 hypothetical protein B456_008G256500 [Gossypium raimondii]